MVTTKTDPGARTHRKGAGIGLWVAIVGTRIGGGFIEVRLSKAFKGMTSSLADDVAAKQHPKPERPNTERRSPTKTSPCPRAPVTCAGGLMSSKHNIDSNAVDDIHPT